MEQLIIINHQQVIPPFMVSGISCAKEMYENVWYVNTRLPRNAYYFDESPNVHIIYPNDFNRFFSKVKAFFSLFSCRSLAEIAHYVKDKGLSIKYLRQLCVTFSSDFCTRFPAQKIIDSLPASDNVTVLSTWLGACAVTASTLKRKNPKIKAYSLAHSYEVLVSRNPSIPYLFVAYKHKYLDGIYFIADEIRKLYFEGVGSLPPDQEARTHVCYLGSYKTEPGINQRDPSSFNICTCSRVIPLKRLDVLCDALRDWDICDIHWTHIGDGAMFEDIKSKVAKITNPRVRISLLGSMPNKQVQQYYSSAPIDLFCNISSIEGLPISIMEAMSYGIPVLATNVGATREIVNSTNGILIDRCITSDIIKKALESFYFMPDKDKSEFRKNSLDTWKNKFDANTNLKELFSQMLS